MGRPTQHTFPLSPFVGGRAIRVRYAIPEPHTPPAGRGVAARDRVAAVIAAGTRPDLSFPNPEAKTASADGTAPARVWESRTPPPTPTTKRGGARQRPPLSCRLPPHARDHGQPPAPADAPAGRQTPPPPRRQPTHRQPADDTPAGDGVLSVNPAINTARQTTNTPTTGMLVESDLLL